MTPHQAANRHLESIYGKRRKMVANRRPDHNPTYSPAPVYKTAPANTPNQKATKPKVAKPKTSAAKPKPKPKAKPRALRTQRSLFGGDVQNLFPSQRKDLTRRRAARKQAKKTKKTLGV